MSSHGSRTVVALVVFFLEGQLPLESEVGIGRGGKMRGAIR